LKSTKNGLGTNKINLVSDYEAIKKEEQFNKTTALYSHIKEKQSHTHKGSMSIPSKK
jgi:hypothetical protein